MSRWRIKNRRPGEKRQTMKDEVHQYKMWLQNSHTIIKLLLQRAGGSIVYKQQEINDVHALQIRTAEKDGLHRLWTVGRVGQEPIQESELEKAVDESLDTETSV